MAKRKKKQIWVAFSVVETHFGRIAVEAESEADALNKVAELDVEELLEHKNNEEVDEPEVWIPQD